MEYLLKNKVNNTLKLEGITNNKMVNISWGGCSKLEENKETYRIELT